MFPRFKMPEVQAPPKWWAMVDTLNRLFEMRADMINAALRGGASYRQAKEWADEEYAADIADLEAKIAKAKAT